LNIILFEEAKIPEKITIKDERAKHIVKILKLKPGDEFSCGLVNGPSGKGFITAIDKNWIYFSWEKMNESVPLYPLALLIGYTRPISSKRILREAASLGVGKIIFTGTDKGEKSYRDSNLWKGEYHKYLIDGAQQAAFTGVPDVEFYKDLADFFRINSDMDTGMIKILLDNIEPDVKLSEYNPGKSNCIISIGSERGWSERERKLFKKHGFVSAGLGRRVLRTETASTAGITLLLAKMGLL
jgi:16S rRNA (uracil1498-N3)-methyltransferase